MDSGPSQNEKMNEGRTSPDPFPTEAKGTKVHSCHVNGFVKPQLNRMGLIHNYINIIYYRTLIPAALRHMLVKRSFSLVKGLDRQNSPTFSLLEMVSEKKTINRPGEIHYI